ncbi:MAG: YraN family protein [Bacteroidales bacterium]|nr:YraN family protein [Bacteroidales bacterium]
MKTQRQQVGKQGEDEACLYLIRQGHTVLERNWRSGHLELDIVSLASDGLHFVEVKTRRAPAAADPEENVDGRKRAHLVRAAQAFLQSRQRERLDEMDIWFDVLTVLIDKEKTTINYYPNAFIPIYA